jgi:hypothetical protein
MELFGYVCSPICKAKAASHGIEVPVFAGQKSVVAAKYWRKVTLACGVVGAVIVALLGVWIWYAWFGSYPHVVFSVKFDERSYAGTSKLSGNDQFVFLHGGTLARYDLKTKKPVWTRELIGKDQLKETFDKRMAKLSEIILRARNADPDHVPRMRSQEDVALEVAAELESGLHLRVYGQNIWLVKDDKMTRYDWDTGKPGQEIMLPGGYYGAVARGDELLCMDRDASGQPIVTHISLAAGESHAEQLVQPMSAAVTVAAGTPPAIPSARTPGGSPDAPAAGLPTGVPGTDAGKPMDPAKVAAQAQHLSYPAKVALPVTVANDMHQEQIMEALNDSPARSRPVAVPAVPIARPGPRFDNATFLNGKYGCLQYSVNLLESKFVARKAMKDAPKTSAFDGNATVGNSEAMINETLNEMQRSRGGDMVEENQSRYQVVVHVPDANGVPDWSGEVIGQPTVYLLKTVNVVTGNKTVIVLDKTNKKLWEANLTYNVPHGGGEAVDDDETSTGEGPCVERGDALYVFDQAMLTSFDLATGNARWRLPSVGIVGLLFDDKGMMYVNSTSATVENIKYSRQIDISQKTSLVVFKVDPKTGGKLWSVEPGGFISHIAGKLIYTVESYRNDTDPDDPYALPGQIPSHVKIQRINPGDGRISWTYAESRAPLDVHFSGNTIELVFRKEVEVLKFLSF